MWREVSRSMSLTRSGSSEVGGCVAKLLLEESQFFGVLAFEGDESSCRFEQVGIDSWCERRGGGFDARCASTIRCGSPSHG